MKMLVMYHKILRKIIGQITKIVNEISYSYLQSWSNIYFMLIYPKLATFTLLLKSKFLVLALE